MVWYKRTPTWVSEGAYSKIELTRILRNHVETVASRYRGSIYAWNVVNEPFQYGSPVDSVWLRAMGSDYIPHTLQWAHDADPDARLFINENWADGLTEQSDALYGLVEDLLRQGVPLHGVGFQMAVGFGDGEEIEHPIPQDELAQNFRRFSELGLEIHVTEMTVRIGAGRGPIEQRLAEQADVYRDVLLK